ncbi:hypothetical protein E2C01_012659 [Portunus trituberculatus]|uniref:Uncharacterized protein n=1 Tax=Portunus trituberculatus TaxID=210409 RepID=A0A5B7DEP4_PORTR|nr:hypothetical protein [Portunus trituberculatus]
MPHSQHKSVDTRIITATPKHVSSTDQPLTHSAAPRRGTSSCSARLMTEYFVGVPQKSGNSEVYKRKPRTTLATPRQATPRLIPTPLH